MRADTHRNTLASLPGVPPLAPLDRAVITGRMIDGKPTITLRDGSAARLAVVDHGGHIVELGDAVERAVWAVALTTYCAALIQGGHVTITTERPQVQSELRKMGSDAA